MFSSLKSPPLTTATASALKTMEDDPDIRAERNFDTTETPMIVLDEVPLNVVNQSHRWNAATKKLVEDLGGLPKLEEFTSLFYQRAFADPHIDQFIREHDDHHGKRFASWIAEKMGAGRPWSVERSNREACPFHAHGYEIPDAFDRSSAHFAAWHSPKRDSRTWGDYFKLDDCRRWMRLHFWAARDTGVLETPFGSYYVRFIAHFVSVYERTAPQFARDAVRWSENPTNIQNYLATKDMPDIMGLSLTDALNQLPPHERGYTGSSASRPSWPYDLPGRRQ